MRHQALALLGLLTLSACADTIHPISVVGANPTMLVNGRLDGACQKYQVFSGSPDAGVGNFEQAGTCVSEAAVFAQGNAMGLQDAVALFTDKKGDRVDVQMAAPYKVPLNIFVMVPDVDSGSVADRLQTAASDITFASQLYDDDNQCGLKYLLLGQVHDATQLQGPLNTNLLTESCKAHPEFIADFNKVANEVLGTTDSGQTAVNVFYIELSQNLLGETCPNGNSDVIVIGQFGGAEKLAHELGHALSLCHPNDPTCYSGDVTKMPQDTLMRSPSSSATKLTAGQCFRTNINSNSVLNQLSIWPGLKRLCPDSDDSFTCPPLWIHK